LAKAVLKQFPAWKLAYDAWWQRKGPGLTKGYAKAVDPEFWTLTKEVLAAGVADVLKTFDNNVTADFLGFDDLEHAGVNSDEVESGFGNVDYVGFRIKCPTSTVFGVAHAQKSGSMLGWDERIRRLKAQRGKRFSEVDLEAENVAWRVKSYFELPADERWRLLRDIQYRFKELCRDKPRAELEAHNNAKRQRQIEAGEMEQRKEQRCALSYAKFKDHAMVTTEQGLTQLQAKHAAKILGTTKDCYIEALRDQIRAREHVYDQTKLKDKLPAIGSNNTLEEEKRIEDGLKPLFALPLIARHSPPTALPTRERSQAVAPTELAKVLLVEYAKKMREAWVKLGGYMGKGVFTLPRRPV